MAVLERWHVGPWTTHGTLPGEPFEPGQKRTPDELNFDVVGLARILGRRLSGREELQVRLWQNELRPTHTRMCGVHTLKDPANAKLLAETAQEALAWLKERVPDGYEFILTDAVYLRPLTDLDAGVVTVDAVLQIATERGDALPADRLAASHVHQSSTGEWFAGDAICNWSGPYRTAEEAADAIRAARVELTSQLTEAGHGDLAATATRWPEVLTLRP
ncbi:hypothetical protein [Kribbella catacumbae]|uniref:hypothetical protein n=1 Tax=Kribbella catacumbae TaxID=460086 RepID=UPI0003779C89|nr:hypothetical protein [Kribbella catacumbae]